VQQIHKNSIGYTANFTNERLTISSLPFDTHSLLYDLLFIKFARNRSGGVWG